MLIVDNQSYMNVAYPPEKKFFSLVSFLILLVLSGGTQLVSAQTFSQTFTLNWMGIRTFSDPGQAPVKALYFEGADFSSQNPSIPAFSAMLPLPSAAELMQCTIGDAVFAPLSDQEAPLVSADMLAAEILPDMTVETERLQQFARVGFLPFRINTENNQPEKLISFTLTVHYTQGTAPPVMASKAAEHSVLATGTWIKMGVKNTGIHKITYSDLVSMGISPASVDPRNIRIYGNGGGILPESNAVARFDDLVENSIFIQGENDGTFNSDDYILFYGESPVSWVWDANRQKFSHINHLYSDYTYYFLTADAGPGKRISNPAVISGPATHTVTTFNDYAVYEKDELNLTKSGKVWYGEKFEIKNTWEISPFSFPDIVEESQVYLEVDLAARSTSTSTFKVYVNNGEAISTLMPPVSPAFNTDYAIPVTASKLFYVNTPTLNVKLSYLPAVSNSIGWLNYVEFNVNRHLRLTGNQMGFRDMSSVGSGNIAEFSISNTQSADQIWDVTDFRDIKRMPTDYQSGVLSFKANADSLREYMLFTGNNYFPVLSHQKIENQDLHALQPVDYIIITHPAFQAQAEKLKTIHETDGLSVLITTPEKIYNEFSSGAQDIAGIRDFIKMLYDRADTDHKPRYVLMFGDGSYDYKNRITDNTNFVPTFQSINSLRPTESYVSDDFFGLMDANEGKDCFGTLDLGVGRLPVKSQDQANAAIEKIELYMGLKSPSGSTSCNTYSSSIQRLGDWRNQICFVADDEDNNMHLDQAEDLATYVDTAYQRYNTDKIYFDSYKQLSTPGGQRYPDVTSDINRKVQRGALIVNYTGHGGETGWAHERVLEISDINSWTNSSTMPVFVTATCEFSRFDDPERTSAGEFVFLNPRGGGIALFTTSRLSFSSTNFALNMNYYLAVFKKTGETYPRMGDVMRKAKTPSNPNIRNFVLLGDPALRMAYPEYNVVTEFMNGKPAGQGSDTLRAYGEVTVSGYISDADGNKMTDFNGILYPTVYDKPVDVTSLGNDPESHPRSFSIRKNLIYKGKVSVTNGEFSFVFVVPKDIAYKYGKGRISYYAENGITDANGVFQDFIIGGSETTYENDLTGPSLSLFMNDTTFRIGGLTDENPLLLARVVDSSGLNTTGNGIGHDIVAVLDENTDQSVILNDFYEADLNSYQSGSVIYPYYGLSDGLHTLRVKIWDIFNNSAEAYTEFVVAGSGELVLESILNYPNPFSDQTVFTFQHNHPCCNLDVEIQIYDINGRLVTTLKETVATNGFNGGPIAWDGSNDAGSPVTKGIYFYKLRIQTEEGLSYEKSSKLIVLK